MIVYTIGTVAFIYAPFIFNFETNLDNLSFLHFFWIIFSLLVFSGLIGSFKPSRLQFATDREKKYFRIFFAVAVLTIISLYTFRVLI